MAEGSNDDKAGAQVRLRSYQQEMLDESLQRNVIVALDTGSGKTHIAIARIQAELDRSGDSKLVWFMTPNKALSEQQHLVVQQHLPAYHIRCLTGADDVDKWTEQRVWDAFLTGVHMVVGTPAVLADALSHGFIKISRLSLCIFDEAHRCTKGHPMNQIMRDFYYPAKLAGHLVPHILGLSASPVMSTKDKDKDLRSIESNLDATIVTPRRYRDELDVFLHRPTLLKVLYESEDLNNDPHQSSSCFAALMKESRTYDFSQDPYVQELQERSDARAAKHLKEAFTKRKTYCAEQLKAFCSRAQALQEQLGGQMTEWFVNTCIQRFVSELDEGLTSFPDMSQKEKHHLAAVLIRVQRSAPGLGTAMCIEPSNMSNKAAELIAYLHQHHATDFRSIVFVEQRAVVKALAHMLRSIPEIAGLYNIGTFMGTSTSSNRKATIADLADMREQASDLDAFRSGAINLMIATNVLEEGIDVPACNGVICFDLPMNLISFVQRRGRARMADSRYVLFVASSDLKADPARFQKLEEQMKLAYMDEHREPPSADEREDDEGLAAMKYKVESTGAMLTTDNAKSHLQHFCAVSSRHTNRYVDARPEYGTHEKARTKTWTASVTLPTFVHHSLRTANSYSIWRSEAAAVKDAAFMAYTALHRAGLVNNNLLPIVQDFGPEPGVTHRDQPSIVTVSERSSSLRRLAQCAHSRDAQWHAADIMLTRGTELVTAMTLWLPALLSQQATTDLYWNTIETYTVIIRPCEPDQPVQEATIAHLASTIRSMLQCLFATRMSSELEGLPFLLDPGSAIGRIEGPEPAIRYFSTANGSTEPGLIRVASQQNKAYMFRELRRMPSEEGADKGEADGEIVVTAFPKRRDFLHKPIEQDQVSAAYTAKQAFPIIECTVDLLPAKYAQFVAFLPSILHRIDVTLLAEQLATSVLQPVGFTSSVLVEEAISAPSAQEQADYNRLEYLGDSILKICTALQVSAQHPIWPEAYLSAEKDRVVRNSNLAQAAIDAGLDQYILTKPFTGSKWRPPCVSELLAQPTDQKRQMSSKILADVVEALIGAALVDSGLSKAYSCIRTLLSKEEWWDHTLIFETLLTGVEGERLASLDSLQDLIGHRFTSAALLTEAITHVSYPQNASGLSYERLEFLGDAVLDLIVTPKLHAHHCKLRHWELHHMHEAVVNAHFLAYCCMSMVGNAQKFDVQVTSGRPQVRQGVRRYHLHDFLRGSNVVLKAKQTSVSRFDKLRASIEGSLAAGQTYPWVDLIAMHAEKMISDMVESILGALYLDTRGDLAACEGFLEKLGVLPMMRRMLESGMNTTHPKERLGILADQDEVSYASEQVHDQGQGIMLWRCLVKMGAGEVARADGCISREEAEVRAADEAVGILIEQGMSGGEREKRKFEKEGAMVEKGA